jgi:hypothetical protein
MRIYEINEGREAIDLDAIAKIEAISDTETWITLNGSDQPISANIPYIFLLSLLKEAPSDISFIKDIISHDTQTRI